MKKFLAVFALFVVFAVGAHAAPQTENHTPVTAQTAAEPRKFTPSVTEVVGAPHEWGYNFQDRTTEMSRKVYAFSNYINIIVAGITLVVLSLVVYIAVRFRAKANPVPSKTTHNTLLEIIWTVIPIIIVIAIVIPSIRLLYYVDRTEKADMTVKIVGYQWYWSYELPDQKVAEFESRMIPEDKAEPKRKLMDVDEPLVLPVGKTVRLLVTADPLGVIHSWGVAGLSFKRDAVPGRISEGWLKLEEPGIYYGQCYELCGVDHAFMPIKVIGVTPEEFDAWVVSKGGTPGYTEGQLTVSDSQPGKHEADANATTKPEALENAPNAENVEVNDKKDEKLPAGTAPVNAQGK